MADSQEPRRFPTAPPGAPLPRIWKVEPELDPEEEEREKKKKEKEAEEAKAKPVKKKAKAAKKPAAKLKTKDGEGKKVLIEETPTLDTYEARQRIRTVIGSVFAVILCVGLFVVIRSFVRSDSTVVDQSVPAAGPPRRGRWPSRPHPPTRRPWRSRHGASTKGPASSRRTATPSSPSRCWTR